MPWNPKNHGQNCPLTPLGEGEEMVAKSRLRLWMMLPNLMPMSHMVLEAELVQVVLQIGNSVADPMMDPEAADIMLADSPKNKVEIVVLSEAVKVILLTRGDTVLIEADFEMYPKNITK